MGSYLSMEATAAEFIRAVSCIFAGNDDGWWAQSGGFTGICGKKAVSRGAFVVMKPKVTAAYNTTRKTNNEGHGVLAYRSKCIYYENTF
jgi:hypothetical protein